MSTDLPGARGANGAGEPGPDAGLREFLRALTAPPAPAELAAEQRTLAMFRDSFGRGAGPAVRSGASPAEPAAAPPAAPAGPWPAGTGPTLPLPAEGTADGTAPGEAPAGRAPGGRTGSWPAWPNARRTRLAAAAIAALVVAGPVAAAYAAVLPPPVQRLAHQLLGFAGVPDAGGQTERPEARPAPRPPSSRPVTSRPSAMPSSGQHPTSSPSASPSRSGSPSRATPGPGSGPARLTIVAEPGQITAGATAVLAGQATRGGRPLAGVTLRLLERPAGAQAWSVAARGTTSAGGRVVIDVGHLDQNADFRLAGARGAASQAVTVTVVPAVSLRVVPLRAGREALVASVPYAQAGDAAVLQVQAGGGWVTVRAHRLGARGGTAFVIRARRRVRTFRVLLPATARHAASASGAVTA